METFRHEDDEHDWLTVAERRGGAALVRCHPGGVEVTPDAIPAITKALYEACGMELPTAIKRQSIPQDGSPIRYGDFQVKLSRGGVTVSLPGIEPCPIPPRAALELAAYIATYAVLAETEPDPAEVEGLATVIHRANCESGSDCIRMPDAGDRKAARDAIRWMNARKAETDRG